MAMRLQCCVLLASAVLAVVSPAAAAGGKRGIPAVPKGTTPALIMFGDSIVDPGNNNAINTIVKANFLPYGIDFINHKPTGRFCNGRIPTDFIAARLGLKELLPAYLAPNLDQDDLLTGVSFASAATGYDPLTPQLASVISLPDQLKLFKEYQDKVKNIAGEAKVQEIMSKGLFAICAGSDDVANTYFTLHARTDYDHASYAKLLVQSASSFVEDLIHVGAKRIGVIGIPPIGCVPSQRTLSGGSDRTCSDGHNEIAVMYNTGLSKEMDRLKVKYPGHLLVYIDIYGFLYDMMMHPQTYGFKVSTQGCCGTGLMEVSVLCNRMTSMVCQNVTDYLFWDSYHPTEKAYKVLTEWAYDNYIHYLVE